MLKKLLFGIVGLAIVVGAAAPFVVSRMVEKQYNQNISQLNAYYKDQFTLVGTFEAGYLTSKATTEIKFVDNPISIKLNHEISNGPVILNSSYMPENYAMAFITTTFDDSINAALMQAYKDKQGYNISTLIDYDGNGTTTLKLDPVIMEIEEGSLDWKGLNLVLLHNKDCTNLTGNAEMPSVMFTENSADAMAVKKIEGKDFKLGFSTGVNATQESIDLMLGDINVSHGEEVIFSAKKLGFSGKVQTSANLLKCDLAYSFDLLTIMQDKYGPFDYKVDLKNLDKEFFKSIADKAPVINESITTDSISNSSAGEIAEVHTAQIISDYPPEKVVAFLAVRPGVAMDFKLQLPDGKILIQASMDIGGPQIKEMDETVIKESITASFSFKIDQAIVYMLLAQYAENNLNMMAEMFAQDPANANVANPYDIPQDQKQAVIEGWIISVLDKLKESRFILENAMVISSDMTYDKNILTINGQEKSIADVNATIMMFRDVIKPATVPAASGAVTTPGTVDPSTTMPGTTEPSSTAPGTVDPSTTMPGTTEPSSTAPGTVDPSTTMPGTTEPSSTAPGTVDPSTTMPGATAPSTTVPTPAEVPSTVPTEPSAPATDAQQPSSNMPKMQPATTSCRGVGATVSGSSILIV